MSLAKVNLVSQLVFLPHALLIVGYYQFCIMISNLILDHLVTALLLVIVSYIVIRCSEVYNALMHVLDPEDG